MAKYLSLAQIRESIRWLEKYHVFFGTTFLVLKQNEAPEGSMMRLALDAENQQHLLRYFRLDPRSKEFFLPFQKRKNDSHWKKPKYASGTLQAINTQSFPKVLLHERDTQNWGWTANYIEGLVERLPKGQRLSILHFAVWFGREESWDDQATREDVIKVFIRKFLLSHTEVVLLFDHHLDSDLSEAEAFQVNLAESEQITRRCPAYLETLPRVVTEQAGEHEHGKSDEV